MATKEDVLVALEALRNHITTETAEVKATVNDLNDQVAALKDKLADGTAISGEDLDTIVSKITELSTGVNAIIATPAAATPPA